MSNPVSLLDIVPTPSRGVVRLETCEVCELAVPIFGAVGKGRPYDTFAPGYFCHGHAIRYCDGCESNFVSKCLCV